MGINLKHPAIKKANAASASEIHSTAHIPGVFSLKEKTYQSKLVLASDLPDEVQTELWNIFELNMKTFYVKSKSFPWDPSEKMNEMFHPLARILLIRLQSHDLGQESPVQAFSIFRFERENKRNMLYCYEFQVTRSAQRSGLGKTMLNMLEHIADAYHMSRILLTGFIANESSLQFYKAMGFSLDEISPEPSHGTFCEFDDRLEGRHAEWSEDAPNDYVILCKAVSSSENLQ